MEDLISVIVPVYNVEAYVERCLNSIINQTYTNIQIIVVDDGSTDQSGKLCDAMAAKDFRIKVFHKKNGGLSSARNFAMEHANGQFFFFVDSDDYISPNAIEVLYCNICMYSADMAVCGYFKVNEEGPLDIVLPSNIPKVSVFSGTEALDLLVSGKCANYVWNKMYKKKLFEQIYFPEGKTFEDIYIMHNIFLKAEKIVFSDEKLYYYVQHQNSITKLAQSKINYDYYNATKKRLDDLRSLGKYDNALFNQLVLRYLSVLKVLSMQRSMYSEHKERILQMQREIKNYCNLLDVNVSLTVQQKIRFYFSLLNTRLYLYVMGIVYKGKWKYE